MKLDDVTVNVLKNFQTINPSIQFKEGNEITSTSPTKTIIARATVPNSFPQDFCIYDLRRFISVTSMLKSAEIDFNETYLTFVEGKKKIKYAYCEPEAIVVPRKEPKKFPEADIFFEFTLTAETIKEAIQGMNVLGHEMLVFKGQDGILSISSKTDVNSDTFSIEIGETDKTFSFIFEQSKLNLLAKDYKASLSKKKHMYLEGEGIEYWISAHKNSSLDLDE